MLLFPFRLMFELNKIEGKGSPTFCECLCARYHAINYNYIATIIAVTTIY